MLFVIGHMRSGSTLLVHLLANHADVLGFGEAHNEYGDVRDLKESAYNIARRSGAWWPRERYILDKVLHPHLDPPPELLRWASTRSILLVRDPERSLPSILDLRLEKTASPATALAYYEERLARLEKLARTLGPERVAFLTFDELLDEPGRMLGALGRFLDLETPIRSEYEPLWSTGKSGFGDPGPHIHSGRIVRSGAHAYDHSMPPDLMAEARASYSKCLENCKAALGTPA